MWSFFALRPVFGILTPACLLLGLVMPFVPGSTTHPTPSSSPAPQGSFEREGDPRQDRAGEAGATEWMDRIREALQVSPGRGTLQVSGRIERFGLPHPFRWTFSPEGHFLREFKGAFAQTYGDGGESAWAQEVRSPSFPVVGLERARTRALAWVWSGAWCQRAGPFELSPVALRENEQSLVIEFHHAPSSLAGTLHLDAGTLFPSELAFDEDHGGGTVHFEDWESTGTPPMPRRVRLSSEIDGELLYDVQISQVWSRPPPAYGDPRASATDSGFQEGVSPVVPARWRPGTGWIVTPKIDGKERGSFVVDPSSAHSFLSRSLGEALGYRPFSSYPGPRALPRDLVSGGLYQGRFLQLGPFVFEGPRFVQVESVQKAPEVEGEPYLGLLGWDLFVRSVVILNAKGDQMELHDAQTYAAEQGKDSNTRWFDLVLVDRSPHLWLEIPKRQPVLVRFDPELSGSDVQLSKALLPIESATLAGVRVTVRPAIQSLSASRSGPQRALGRFGPGALPAGDLIFDYWNSRLGICKTP